MTECRKPPFVFLREQKRPLVSRALHKEVSPNGVGTHGVSLALGDGHNPVRTVSIIAGFSMESNTPPRANGDEHLQVYDRRSLALCAVVIPFLLDP